MVLAGFSIAAWAEPSDIARLPNSGSCSDVVGTHALLLLGCCYSIQEAASDPLMTKL